MPDMRALVVLILVFGFKTDADEPGVEKIVATVGRSSWFEFSSDFVTWRFDSPVAAGSLGCVKGWARINAALFIVAAAIQLDVMPQLRGASGGSIYASFQVVHCIIPDCATEEDLISKHREVVFLSEQIKFQRGSCNSPVQRTLCFASFVLGKCLGRS